MTEKQKVLVVDDEPLIRELLEETLRRCSLEVRLVTSGSEAIKNLHEANYDLVISDVRLPDINGMEILHEANNLPSSPGVIMITAFGTVEDAVKAMKFGAYDYITKPFNPEEIELTLNKYFKFRELEQENKILKDEIQHHQGINGIVGKSTVMQRVYEKIRMVAPAASTVLIRGESGTGKELVARAIHELSQRRKKPFVKMNCAALPETMVESELFGHEKGAFTGAIAKKDGRFMAANTGTLLLDEISEMGIHLQAKLLRVLQEREFEPLGSTKTCTVDVRIIATSNRDLETMVKDGLFRQDLFYRLNVVPVLLPSLRERLDDLPYLVNNFVKKFCALNGRQIDGADPEVFKRLEEHDWPGNVRELENAIERVIVTTQDRILKPNHFDFLKKESAVSANGSMDWSKKKLREIEKQVIQETLVREAGNRTNTAKALGISVRTLRNKLREYRQE